MSQHEPLSQHRSVTANVFALHATGVGLALPAYSPPTTQEVVLANPLQPYSTRTITDPTVLRSKLAEIRQSGFAISDGQVTTDALSVAAPIHGADGLVVAAVSIVIRITDTPPMGLVPAVRSVARAIGRTLASGQPAIPRPTPSIPH